MKKQEFHRHKVRFSDVPQLDYDELKNRTIIALNKLGHQRFPTEPGGYSLENWARGVNLLLDEFEEKVGAAKLPPEYAEKRRQLKDCLNRPIDLSSVNDSMTELKQNEAEVVRKLDEARTRTASRIDELQSELVRCSAELEEEKRRPSSVATERSPGSFFRRLFGRNLPSSVGVSEDRVKELESRLRTLPGEILEQQKCLKSINRHSSESPWAEEWRMLESLQVRLKELENERLEKMQLVREREVIIVSIASTISSISLGEDKTEGESVS